MDTSLTGLQMAMAWAALLLGGAVAFSAAHAVRDAVAGLTRNKTRDRLLALYRRPDGTVQPHRLKQADRLAGQAAARIRDRNAWAVTAEAARNCLQTIGRTGPGQAVRCALGAAAGLPTRKTATPVEYTIPAAQDADDWPDETNEDVQTARVDYRVRYPEDTETPPVYTAPSVAAATAAVLVEMEGRRPGLMRLLEQDESLKGALEAMRTGAADTATDEDCRVLVEHAARAAMIDCGIKAPGA